MSGQIQGRLAYYPGCCGARGEGLAYTRAALACCSRLGLEVVKLRGWNCCGEAETSAWLPWQRGGLCNWRGDCPRWGLKMRFCRLRMRCSEPGCSRWTWDTIRAR